jgi:signal transduction histidine kinase/CheY-like chemotaxis protein
MSLPSTDQINVINDDAYSSAKSDIPAWKILIADDDEDVHSASKLALDDYRFMGRELEFFNAFSGKETIELLGREKDIAIILLDVVMETDDAGLIAVRKIREELFNREIRIILRTGQPGYAPEFEVINSYDINDYKTKSELTQSKLIATITTALRSYNQVIELKKARNDLRRITMFPERNPQSVCQLNLEGEVIYSNPGSKKLLEKFDIEGSDIRSIFPDNMKQTLNELRISNKESVTSEFSHGTGIIQVHIQFLRDLLFFNLYIEDVTEKKQLEKELFQSHKMQAVGHLTGGIAHDFNNIQAVILGYSNLAMEHIQASNDDKLKRYLSSIINSGERASRLVEEMLIFSRTNNDTGIIIEPEKVVNETVELLKGSLPSSLVINLLTANKVPNIFIDPIKLEQIIMNICINGRDAMNEVGQLDIKVQSLCMTDDLKEIPTVMSSLNSHRMDICFCKSKHTYTHSGNYAEISIRDTGTGISKERMDHIFDPFFTSKEVGKGTGLGLSIIHGIMQGANGHIIVETEEEKGTLFRFIFSEASNTEDKGLTNSEENEIISNQEHGRILLVDDEVSLLDCMEEFLESHGYDVIKSSNSTLALDMFSEEPEKFDLVITDQTMPKLTGTEFSKKLLKIRPDIPIILCTGYSELISEASAIEVGIRAYMKKPTDPAKLISNINEFILTSNKK